MVNGTERLSRVKTHSGQTEDIVGPAMSENDDASIEISDFGTTTCSGNDLLMTLQDKAGKSGFVGRRYKASGG